MIVIYVSDSNFCVERKWWTVFVIKKKIRMSLFLCSGLCVSMVEPLHFECTIFPVHVGAEKDTAFGKLPPLSPQQQHRRASPQTFALKDVTAADSVDFWSAPLPQRRGCSQGLTVVAARLLWRNGSAARNHPRGGKNDPECTISSIKSHTKKTPVWCLFVVWQLLIIITAV